jgi:hypothetical protein
MVTRVAIVHAKENIKATLEHVPSLLGSPEKETRHQILIKPNLFTTITAEKGATTTLWRITYITDPPIHHTWSR